MSNWSIRPANELDLDRIIEVSTATFEHTFIEIFQRPYTKEDLNHFYTSCYNRQCYRDWITKPGYKLFVLIVEDEIEGYSVLGPCQLPHEEVSETCGELKRFYIQKDFQGLGMGRKLLSLSLDWLSQNYQTQWIGVWSGNTKAQAIYLKRGFEKVGEYIFPVGKVLDREFILKRASSGKHESDVNLKRVGILE